VSGSGRLASSSASLRRSLSSRASACSHARSSVRATRRFSGSQASIWRSARGASYCARSTASRCPRRRSSCWRSSSPTTSGAGAPPGRRDRLKECCCYRVVQPQAAE
jgi:hypothetical protein